MNENDRTQPSELEINHLNDGSVPNNISESIISINQVICGICKRAFNNQRGLNIHTVVHNPGRSKNRDDAKRARLAEKSCAFRAKKRIESEANRNKLETVRIILRKYREKEKQAAYLLQRLQTLGNNRVMNIWDHANL